MNPSLLAAGVTAFTCCLLWLALWWAWRRQTLTLRHLSALLLAAGLVCRLAYVAYTPPYYAPDEQSHYNYIKYLAEHGQLPVATTQMGDAANEWEYFQPPLYYLTLTPLYQILQHAGCAPATTLRLLRGTSILFWVLNFWCAGHFLNRLGIDDAFARLFVLGLVALLPTYTFVSAALNNDNLLALLGGAVLLLMAGGTPTRRRALLLGATIGAALLTKQSALVLLPAVVLWRMLLARGEKQNLPAALSQLAVILGVAVIIYAPWAWRNWSVYHTLTPEQLSAQPIQWPSFLHGLASAGHNLTKTFWAVSGISNDVGYPFPLLGYGLLVIWFAGLQKRGPQSATLDPIKYQTHAPVLTTGFLTALLAALLVLRFGYQFGMGQGRHLLFLLYPLGLVLVTGLRTLPIPQREAHAVGFWFTYAASFAAFSLTRFP